MRRVSSTLPLIGTLLALLAGSSCRQSTTLRTADVVGTWGRPGDAFPPVNLTLTDSASVLAARLQLSGTDARGTAVLDGNRLRLIIPGRLEIRGELVSRDELQIHLARSDTAYTLRRIRPDPAVADTVIRVDGRALSAAAIDRYLEKAIGFTSEGGGVKCAHAVLGQMDARLFLETVCLEFVRRGDSVANASGRAGPVALRLSTVGDSVRIVSHEVPVDGGGHAESIRRIFPADVAQRILSADGRLRTRMVDQLKAHAERQLLR